MLERALCARLAVSRCEELAGDGRARLTFPCGLRSAPFSVPSTSLGRTASSSRARAARIASRALGPRRVGVFTPLPSTASGFLVLVTHSTGASRRTRRVPALAASFPTFSGRGSAGFSSPLASPFAFRRSSGSSRRGCPTKGPLHRFAVACAFGALKVSFHGLNQEAV